MKINFINETVLDNDTLESLCYQVAKLVRFNKDLTIHFKKKSIGSNYNTLGEADCPQNIIRIFVNQYKNCDYNTELDFNEKKISFVETCFYVIRSNVFGTLVHEFKHLIDYERYFNNNVLLLEKEKSVHHYENRPHEIRARQLKSIMIKRLP